MTDKELRKLGRGELLEMLLAQSKEAESLRSQLEEATAQMESRNIDLTKAGSIAEAALSLNGVFTAAQAAADQYLENVRRMTGRQEEICDAMEAESKARADQLLSEAKIVLAEAEEKRDAMLKETEEQCIAMKAAAKKESEQYWTDVSSRLENFYAEHAGLRELLGQMTPKEPNHK
ncbi:MAG: hypothetical protein ACI4PP_05500 [Clostridia bacterium]